MIASVSTHLFAFYRLEEKYLQWIADAGFSSIELWGAQPHFNFHDAAEVQRVLGWLCGAGLSVGSVHLPFYHDFREPTFRYIGFSDEDEYGRRLMADKAKQLINLCPTFGSRFVVLHPVGKKAHDPQALPRLRRELDWFAPYCAERGIKIALENVMLPGSRANHLADLCRDYAPTLGICLDLGHALIDGGVAEEIEAAGEYILAVHVHDNRGAHDEHLLPGRGVIDWPAVFAALSRHSPNLRHFTFELMIPVMDDAIDEARYREILNGAQLFWRSMTGTDT